MIITYCPKREPGYEGGGGAGRLLEEGICNGCKLQPPNGCPCQNCMSLLICHGCEWQRYNK